MELSIDVVSDVVCPWCFVGERRLRSALALLQAAEPQVVARLRWLPFFLNPDTPAAGEPYHAFLVRKFGGEAPVRELQARVAAAGRDSGVSFAFERIAIRPNTLNAHRLILRTQRDEGDAGPLVRRLFEGYFQRGENLADDTQLAAIAAECGADAPATRAYLAGDEDAGEVRALARRVQRGGVNGVPFFIIGGMRALSGAQPPETLLAAMRAALDERP